MDFTAEAEIREEDEVLLRFDGIDTLADIWLNEVYLGKTNNMHRIWEFSVKSLLKEEKYAQGGSLFPDGIHCPLL